MIISLNGTRRIIEKKKKEKKDISVSVCTIEIQIKLILYEYYLTIIQACLFLFLDTFTCVLRVPIYIVSLASQDVTRTPFLRLVPRFNGELQKRERNEKSRQTFVCIGKGVKSDESSQST